MSKEEFLKIQTCTLKVDIHCDGCVRKVKKILEKIEGVYKVGVDSGQGKVTVSGIVDPQTLIEKLRKRRKQAQVWGVPKENKPTNKQQLEGGKSGPTPQQLQLKDMKLPFEKCGQKSKPVIDESDDVEEEEEDNDDDMDDIIGGRGMKPQLMKGGQKMKEVGNGGKKVEGDQNHFGGRNNNADGGDQSEDQNTSGNNVSVNGVHGMPNMSGRVNGLPVGVQMNVYVQGAGPHPNYQQQLMNQQRPNDNEMYARPPPDLDNMQPPYPYPQGHSLTHFFSDYNTSSCNVM